MLQTFREFLTETRDLKSKVKGLRYSLGIQKGKVMEFRATIEIPTHDDIVLIGDGAQVKDPEKFAKLADKIFKKMNFNIKSAAELDIEKLKKLQREFSRHLDFEFGESMETSFHFVK